MSGIEYDPALTRRELTREQYDLLVEAGALEGQPVELLEGRIVEMSPQGPGHGSALRRLTQALTLDLVRLHGPGVYMVAPQTPLAVSSRSEPEPDVAVIDASADAVDAHPRTAHLVVEIAHSSQRADLLYKPGIYAGAGVGQYWVVDLPAREVVVHSEPYGGSDPGYRQVRRVGIDTELAVLGARARLADLLS